MDYETPDGSQISLREVWTKKDGKSAFEYTSVSAYVEGNAYVGKLAQLPQDVDDADVLNSLEPVPKACIHPPMPDGFAVAPEFDLTWHYLKAPSFTYEDCRPGKTFVADCVLNEASVLERLKAHPHPNIVKYYGCVVKDGLITHISLKKYPRSLVEYAEPGLSDSQKARIFNGVKEGIHHLHSLGLAHNDITPQNICVDADGEAIIVDFDSCLPFGENLLKSAMDKETMPLKVPISSQDNDLIAGIDVIIDFLDADSNER